MLGNEQTLIKIGKQIKCPECAGQTIDTSTTPLSIKLKKFIMNQLEQGAKPEHIVSEIKKHMVKIFLSTLVFLQRHCLFGLCL